MGENQTLEPAPTPSERLPQKAGGNPPPATIQLSAPPATKQERGCLDQGWRVLKVIIAALGVTVMGALVLACVLVVATLVGVNTGVNAITSRVSEILNPPTPAPLILDSATVLTLVHRYSVLETVRYNYEKVVPVEFAQAVGGVGGEKLLYIGVGYVSAGVDLSTLGEDAITVGADGGVAVTLPPAHLTACVLDAQQSYVYRQDVGFLNFITDAFNDEPDLLELAEQEAIKAFRDSALESGILAQAQADAEMHLRAILIAAGVEAVTFHQSESATPEREPACYPPESASQ